MGVDIHMYIVKDKEIIADNIFDGRNSEWFNNLMQRGNDDEYDYLPVKWNISPMAPDILETEYKEEDGYYGFRYMKVEDFMKWFDKYRPDKDAGWVTAYDKWAYKNKHYYVEPLHYFPSSEEINPNDLHFIEVINYYDCSRWLYKYIKENNIPMDADITYWFDC